MNFIFLLLLAAAFTTIQCYLGGTRLLFAFPAYALVSVAAIFSIACFRKACPRFSLGCICSTLALAGYVLYRTQHSPFEFLARPDFYMALSALAVYLLTSLYFTGVRERLLLLGVFFVLALGQVAVGTIQFAHNPGFMMFGFLRPDTTTPRSSGFFVSGNHYAGLLECLAVFALAITFWSRVPRIARLLSLCVALLCYLGVATSGSRGGYLSSGFSLAVFSAISLAVLVAVRPKKVLPITAAGLAAILLIVGVAGALMLKSSLLRDRLSLIPKMTQDVRVYNWQAALDQAHVNPLFGTGSGTHLIFGRLFRRPAIQTDPVHAHSDYLEMLAEYGIVGEALALILLAVHLVHGATGAYQIAVKRLRGSQGPARSDVFALSIGAVCATAALVSHSVVDFNMHIPGNALFYAFVFGILANPGAERNPATPNWISPSTLFRALLPPLGIVTLFVINPLITPELLTEQARVALRDQRFKECIAKARDAADDDPKNPFPHYYAGEANRVTGLALGSNIALRKSYFTSAINSFTAGLKVFPLDENMLVRSAQCLDATLQLKAADEAYQKAIRWDPNLGVLYAYYASHLHVLGRSTVEKAYRDTAGRLGSPNPQTTGMAEVHSMLELKSDKSSTSPTPENAATTLD